MSNVMPLTPFLRQQGFVILDGGLATEIEKRGHNLNNKLWSASILISHPEEIRDVHLSYLIAGADCITTASYQSTIPGLLEAGMPQKEAKALILISVDLALEAREIFWKSDKEDGARIYPLVAASIGPYGAYLADGSEYHGNYDISKVALKNFHQSRWEMIANSKADLFACETIPSYQEAAILLDLLKSTPGKYAWMSFSCKDEKHISDGTTIAECVDLVNGIDQVVAIGINCTAPKHISSLVSEIVNRGFIKPIVVYPNSGEIYNSNQKTWEGQSDILQFETACIDWYKAGATLIGGCCRTGPEHIKAIRSSLTRELDKT